MIEMQRALVAPKDKNAGRYKYRSAEDLYEKIKPLLSGPLQITTGLVEMAGRVFVEATATYKEWSAKGYAELEKDPKNMSLGQATGAATSYAIKYAICMLFLVDNGEDLDGREQVQKVEKANYVPDLKREIFEKMTQAGMKRDEMKGFWDTYCVNQTMQKNVLDHFDRFLDEWRQKGA